MVNLYLKKIKKKFPLLYEVVDFGYRFLNKEGFKNVKVKLLYLE